MASMRVTILAAVLAVVLAAASAGAMTPEQRAKLANLRNKHVTDAHYVKEDLQYIRCGTCMSMVHQMLGVLGEMKSNAAKNNTKADEGELLDVVEHLCDTDSHGLWIRWLDLQEMGGQLQLVNMQRGPGACGSECRTIAKACQDIIDAVDVLELSEKVWSGLEVEPLAKDLCREMTSVCRKPDPLIPKDRVPGPQWEEDSLPPEWVKKQEEAKKAAKKAAKKKAKAQKAEAEL